MKRHFGFLLLLMASLACAQTYPTLSGNNTFTGTNTFSGATYLNGTVGPIAAQSVNGTVNLSSLTSYADVCLAASAQSAGTAMYLPAGRYTCSNPINLVAGSSLSCAPGLNTTTITSNVTGPALTTSGSNTMYGCTFVFGSSVTDGLQIKGNTIFMSNFAVSGGANSTNLIHVTAYNGSTQSGKVFLENGVWNSFSGTGLYVDHVIDFYGFYLNIYAASGNTTAYGQVIDTGVSGVYEAHVHSELAARGGVVIKNSTGGAGAYNQYPNYLFLNGVIADCASSACPSDAILADSTLGANSIYGTFVDSWAAGYNSNGFHFSGGQGWKIVGGTKVRSNGLNGVLVDNANVADVEIADSFITANNTTNNADAHGVYVNQNVYGVSIHGNLISNVLDTTGHQVYGIKFGAYLSDKAEFSLNNLYGNTTGNYLYSATGSRNTIGNAIGSANFLSDPLTVNASVFLNTGGVYAPAISFNNGGGGCLANLSACVIPAAVTGYLGSSGTKVVLGTNAGASGQATCWKTDGSIGYCSTAVNSSGACTCH